LQAVNGVSAEMIVAVQFRTLHLLQSP